MILGSGKLRQRATLSRLVESAGSMGGISSQWSEIARFWANIDSATSSESFNAGIKSANFLTVYCRYTSITRSILTGDMITIKGKAYIVEADPVDVDLLSKFIMLSLVDEVNK